MTFSEHEQKLVQFFVEREGDDVLEAIREIDFLADGILDSLDMVSLSVYIEERFGVKVDLSADETMTAMSGFDSLMALIDKA